MNDLFKKESHLSWFSEISTWAKSLENKWKLAHDQGHLFSNFAFQQMKNHSFHINFQLQQNIQEILELKNYPAQFSPHSKFGNPPITLYISEDNSFFLDLYIWVESQTSIHQHNFEGAFTVLQGQSLETVYSFKPEKTMDPSQWGSLKHKELIHLRPGDVREIYFKEGLIHRVLHIAKPTISLVLRSGKIDTPLKVPQYNYDFGMLASPGFPAGDVVAKFRALKWYLNSGHTPTYKMVESLMPYAELWNLLANYPQAKVILYKLTVIQNEPELVKQLSKQNLFLKLFSDIEGEEERILLTAFEYYGTSWTEWIEKKFAFSPLESKQKLLQAVRSLAWFEEELFKTTFLEELFEYDSTVTKNGE